MCQQSLKDFISGSNWLAGSQTETKCIFCVGKYTADKIWCLLIHIQSRKSLSPFSFPAIPDYSCPINKRKKLSEGHSNQLHPSPAGELLTLLLFPLTPCGWIKAAGAWGAEISRSGSGIIPISLQNDAPNPTGQVQHGGGCPRQRQRNRQQDGGALRALKWYSDQKWGFESQTLQTRGLYRRL